MTKTKTKLGIRIISFGFYALAVFFILMPVLDHGGLDDPDFSPVMLLAFLQYFLFIIAFIWAGVSVGRLRNDGFYGAVIISTICLIFMFVLTEHTLFYSSSLWNYPTDYSSALLIYIFDRPVDAIASIGLQIYCAWSIIYLIVQKCKGVFSNKSITFASSGTSRGCASSGP